MFTFGPSNPQTNPHKPEKSEAEKKLILALGNSYDKFLQSNTQIKKATEDHSEKIILADLEFKQNTLPLFSQRSHYIRQIPQFWTECLLKHSDTKIYFLEDNIKEFMRKHLIDFEIIYANNPEFPADRKLYGREGLIFRFEFSKNEYFTDVNLGKACGKKKDENGQTIAHCKGMTINWVSKEKKMELMGAGLENTPSLNGESIDVECSLNFFSWLTLDVQEDDGQEVEMNDDGLDKFSQALTEDLWAEPMVWYTCEADSDSSSDDDEDIVTSSDEEDM